MSPLASAHPNPSKLDPLSASKLGRSASAGGVDRFPWILFWGALILRLGYMTFAHTWHLRTHWENFEFGYEMGRIAKALNTGYGFADPFWGHSGPTAWEPPLYPWLLAGVFHLFGVYSRLSAWVTLAINCVLGAFTVPAVWQIARRCFNRKVALWSALVWAFYPAAMQYDVKWVWEMTLTSFLFTWAVALALRMRGLGEPGEAPAEGATPLRWALFAVLWALIALSNPSLELFLPACGLWILWGSPAWKRQLAYGTMAAVIFLGCLAPWVYRNERVFHKLIPVRSDFGFELYVGNGPGATGFIREYDHPFEDPAQLALYKRIGEIAYIQQHGEVAKRTIAQHPGEFLKRTVKRVYLYWAGVPEPAGAKWWVDAGRDINFEFASLTGLLGMVLALRRRTAGRWLLFWAFALLPVTYYFITVHARFRHPLESLICIVTVYLFQSAEKSWKVRWFSRHA